MPRIGRSNLGAPTCGPVDRRVHLVVDGVDVGSLLDEELDDVAVSGDDGQVQRRVPLLVFLVQQRRFGFQDLVCEKIKKCFFIKKTFV